MWLRGVGGQVVISRPSPAERWTRNELVWGMAGVPRKEDWKWRSLVDQQDMLVQPFLPNVMADGEISLIWIDGSVTHGVLKRAKSGDFRVQDDHGGTVEVIDVSPQDKALAEDIMAVSRNAGSNNLPCTQGST